MLSLVRQEETHMTQRNAFILAAALTAFMLVVVGGVIARAGLFEGTAAAAAAPTAAPTAAILAPEREVEYQRLIQQANEQLLQAYSQTAPAQPPAQTGPTDAITPELAATIALNLAPGASLSRTPELVDFQGQVAYEVQLDRGLVYVDANTGQVLHNGAQPVFVGEHEEHEEHEEEYEDHDEDEEHEEDDD
jgi:uncharacterized membrane protein YkoI